MHDGAASFSVDYAALAAEQAKPRRHRRIAIIGFGRSAVDAPVADPSWELWGMNGFHRAASADFKLAFEEARWALWFDMHTLAYTREYGAKAKIGDAQEVWLQQPHPFPILSVEARPEWPSVEPYPIDDVIAKTGRDYFTSTIAYALALALTMDGVAEVGLWGIDLCHDTEYSDQRPCAEYWIARLEAAGVKISIHSASALLRQRGRYGYEPENELLRDLLADLRRHEAKQVEALAQHQAAMQALQAQAHTDDGALQQTRATIGRLEIWQRGGKV